MSCIYIKTSHPRYAIAFLLLVGMLSLCISNPAKAQLGANYFPNVPLVNQDGKSFDVLKNTGELKTLRGNLLFLSAGDLDGDRGDDLVFIEKKSVSNQAQILFNNKKGYYYRKPDFVFPHILSGMERVDMIDLDQDGDRDLFFTGRKVLREDGSVHKTQAQLIFR